MSVSVSAVRESARNPVAASCKDGVGKADIIAPVFSGAGSCKWFIGLSKKLSPNKPAAAIHHLTGEPERTCYEWVRGKFDPPSRALIKLLHSEVGWIVLEYLMRGCAQPWWQEVLRARRCAAAYEQEREQFEMAIE